MTRISIAFATADGWPRLDNGDGPLLRSCFEEQGFDTRIAVWTDPDVDWSRFDAVLIRTTWDYTEQRDAFCQWAENVDTVSRLFNPAPIVRWNTDKTYLRDLEEKGIPIVPTRFVAPGEPAPLPETGSFVVKPTVSAGARDTRRYESTAGPTAAPFEQIRSLHDEGRTVMVQPYQSAVDERGETALIYFSRRFSHAIRKSPLLTETGEPETDRLGRPVHRPSIRPRVPSPEERDLGERILEAVPGNPALPYARVDLVPGGDGRPRLLELELTEPSLFLRHGDGAAPRFAEAVRDRLTSD